MKKRTHQHRGAVIMVLVIMIMIALLIGIFISKWVETRQKGNLQMRVAIKEHQLAQDAIQEARRRILNGTIPPSGQFTYYALDGSTVSVRVDAASYP